VIFPIYAPSFDDGWLHISEIPLSKIWIIGVDAMTFFLVCLKYTAILVVTSPIWLTIFLEVWQGIVKPGLISKTDIDLLVKGLIAEHGVQAARIAFIDEDRAWRLGDSFEQGKWRRVRKEIERRNTDNTRRP
jgi:hypothetical protein